MVAKIKAPFVVAANKAVSGSYWSCWDYPCRGHRFDDRSSLLFNLATTRTEQKIAARRYEQDQKVALDKQREDLLQIYLDRMSELLLEKKLRSSAPDAEVRNVARVRTTTLLFQLDARRIGYVFAFLRESGLMFAKQNSSIVSLSGADLRKINLSQANLIEADLSGANLIEADLIEANLRGANLSKANLIGADLHGAYLIGADLRGAYLNKADLSEAQFFKADLNGADLHGAHLLGAKVTEEQLKQAKSLERATMPDGTVHP